MNPATRFPGTLVLSLILAVLFTGEAKPFQVNGKPIPDKVALVNGVALDSKLLISEIKVYRLMNRQQNKTLTEKEMDEFSHQALNRLVDQELIFQQAREKNIRIKPELLEQRVQEVQKQFPSKQLLYTALDMQGLTMDLLKTKFEKQMVEEALIRQEVVPNIKVGDAEVEAFYQKNLDRFQTPEKYEVHHIFAAALNSGAHSEEIQDPALRKKAERLNTSYWMRMRKIRYGGWIANYTMEPISRNWPGNTLKMAKAAPKAAFGEPSR